VKASKIYKVGTESGGALRDYDEISAILTAQPPSLQERLGAALTTAGTQRYLPLITEVHR